MCMYCKQPAQAKLRLEIAKGAATYVICFQPSCIDTATRRANENLHNAGRQQQQAAVTQHDDAIPAKSTPVKRLTP